MSSTLVIMHSNCISVFPHCNGNRHCTTWALREDNHSPLKGPTCSDVRGNDRCLFCHSYETHKYTVWVNAKFVLCYSTQRPYLTSVCPTHFRFYAPCQFAFLNLRPFNLFDWFISTHLIFFLTGI